MAAPKKLLIWTENYWIGGCDRFLVDLVKGLPGDDVAIALAGNPHQAFDAWLDRRVPWLLPRAVIPIANLVRTPWHRLDRRRSADSGPVDGDATSRAALARDAGVAGARYGQAAVNLVRLRSLLARAAPDVLLINNGGYPGGESCRMASIAGRQAGVGRVVHFVHNMAYPPAWPEPVERALDSRVDTATDRWVTAAHRASYEFSRRRGVDRGRVHTVHYGLADAHIAAGRPDLALRSELGFGGGQPALAVVANLEPRKGLSVLLQALADLRGRGFQLRTALVGDGPERSRLESEIAALGLGENVRLLGWREDVDAIMAEADVLALPSLANECLPYVILEAMAHRLPVVSTDVAGIPEMVRDGETGRIVSPGDVAALATALAQTAFDPDRAREMGERGHARLREQFGADRMTKQMSELLGIG